MSEPKREREHPVEEDQYEYFDVTPEGKAFLSYVVMRRRYADGRKEFPQKRPNRAFDPKRPESRDTNPAWLWNLQGVKRVLWRLPELRAALRERPGRFVFVVEGEKDVRTAAQYLKVCSTTHPGGALKWTSPQYTEELRDQNVVLIPDEDAVFENPNRPGTFECPGIDHVRDVARKLLGGGARSVRLLRLPDVPPGGDLTDWHTARVIASERQTQAGGDPIDVTAEFRALTNDAPLLTLETVADIRPRGEPVWPIPAGQWAATVPKPGTPEPAPADPAPAPAPNETADQFVRRVEEVAATKPAPTTALMQISATLGDLRRAAPNPPRSVAEWLGELRVAEATFAAALPGLAAGDYATVRAAALLLAAQIARGLDGLAELRTGG